MDFTNKPLAIPGLISYRYKGPYGYIMIGAINHEDAIRQAAQSTLNPLIENPQVWEAGKYTNVLKEVC